MTVDEITEAVLSELMPICEGFTVENPRMIDGYLAINQFIAIQVEAISSGIRQQTDIEVIDLNNASIGTLCFCRSNGNMLISEFTIWKYVAFLADADFSEIGDNHYSFKKDCLILDAAYFQEYRDNYLVSAPIWGKFSHIPIEPLEHEVEVNIITAIPGIKIASEHHRQSINRFIYANNPFERFLKIYQSIELLFDFVLVKRIKALDENIAGFSQIYSEFGRSELDRLKRIMREFCNNHNSLASSLLLSTPFSTEREEIFFHHSKTGNIVSDVNKWNLLIDCIDNNLLNPQQFKLKRLVQNEDDFGQFITDLCAYWIYRVRCSIAHNRIGEFVLQDDHKSFISLFAEPLVLEAAKQIFANPEFAAL
ncbi:hypothetical protein [Blastomonas sp. SL216]|uniref:hypothetical protein n=1 Tax=Blastomonas sp. SL216 TaxID=2995169 RepID=UPI002377AB0E|nr:hypothetical protein OU999_01845 [Blastomonas sp. SL216]